MKDMIEAGRGRMQFGTAEKAAALLCKRGPYKPNVKKSDEVPF